MEDLDHIEGLMKFASAELHVDLFNQLGVVLPVFFSLHRDEIINGMDERKAKPGDDDEYKKGKTLNFIILFVDLVLTLLGLLVLVKSFLFNFSPVRLFEDGFVVNCLAAIIARFFQRVREHMISFIDQLESFLGLLIARVTVRMIQHRQPLVRGLDIACAGGALYL